MRNVSLRYSQEKMLEEQRRKRTVAILSNRRDMDRLDAEQTAKIYKTVRETVCQYLGLCSFYFSQAFITFVY